MLFSSSSKLCAPFLSGSNPAHHRQTLAQYLRVINQVNSPSPPVPLQNLPLIPILLHNHTFNPLQYVYDKHPPIHKREIIIGEAPACETFFLPASAINAGQRWASVCPAQTC